MTIEEAINELKHAYAFCKSEPSFQEAINIVINNHVAYAWHDLRKDSEDLPNDGDDCILVSLKIRGIEMWSVCNYEDGMFHDGINPPRIFNKDIMAWKYIELFEEGVE